MWKICWNLVYKSVVIVGCFKPLLLIVFLRCTVWCLCPCLLLTCGYFDLVTTKSKKKSHSSSLFAPFSPRREEELFLALLLFFLFLLPHPLNHHHHLPHALLTLSWWKAAQMSIWPRRGLLHATLGGGFPWRPGCLLVPAWALEGVSVSVSHMQLVFTLQPLCSLWSRACCCQVRWCSLYCSAESTRPAQPDPSAFCLPEGSGRSLGRLPDPATVRSTNVCCMKREACSHTVVSDVVFGFSMCLRALQQTFLCVAVGCVCAGSVFWLLAFYISGDWWCSLSRVCSFLLQYLSVCHWLCLPLV